MKNKPFKFVYELRFYKGHGHDPKQFLDKIQITYQDRLTPANAKAMAYARKIWAGACYPTEENIENLGLCMEPEEIELVLELSKLPQQNELLYGQFVRLPCPQAGKQGVRLYEFKHSPPGAELDPKWDVLDCQKVIAA